MSEKFYTLPDLPYASYTELQGLVRRLIEYADFSTLPAIADELREAGRLRTLDHFTEYVGDQVHRLKDEYRSVRWRWFGDWLTSTFWIDLFGWDGAIRALSGRIQEEVEVYTTPADAMAEQAGIHRAFRVQEDLSEGEWVVQDYGAVTLRRARPEEIPAAPPEPAQPEGVVA